MFNHGRYSHKGNPTSILLTALHTMPKMVLRATTVVHSDDSQQSFKFSAKSNARTISFGRYIFGEGSSDLVLNIRKPGSNISCEV